ncbi:hypothetical protein SAMN04489727_8277 [Amycolatopsis tolypomycina]|uniref:S-layer homology domain-containing protein n=1 Tax=Amycolatopsis tolypomycina TaxID=208445 RepID=A0A1H5BH49_9PSEU|nr:hypothetical protein SAMN04489727_8277 [Amycolatopsis tolypomycina]
MAAVLLAAAPAGPARAAEPAAPGYRACSVLRTVTRLGWAPGRDGRYHPVTVRRTYAVTVVFPADRFPAPAH